VDELKIDKLMLDRWFFHNDLNQWTPPPEDYISSAVDLLVAGKDTPSLRILAGLNPIQEQYEIDEYFIRTCEELGLESLALSGNPRDAVPLVRRLSQSGTLSPEEAVRRMCSLFELSDYSDPLLEAWYALADYLANIADGPVTWIMGVWPAGYFRLPEETEPLDETIDREWELFDRAVALDLPDGFQHFVRCEGCRHIGPHARLSIFDRCRNWKLGYAIGSMQPLWKCAKCGETFLLHMACAEVREDYFTRLLGGGESPSLTEPR